VGIHDSVPAHRSPTSTSALNSSTSAIQLANSALAPLSSALSVHLAHPPDKIIATKTNVVSLNLAHFGRKQKTMIWLTKKIIEPSPKCALTLLTLLIAIMLPSPLRAQTSVTPPKPATPEWAQPGSATHTQVAPPPDFHRPSKSFNTPIGIFPGQADIGSPIIPGSASFDSATGQYTINSAGYNIWYTRDEFRFLWKKLSGDLSLAADIAFPDPSGYGDRKAVLIIRQDLDDDSKEVVVALHGLGMIQLGVRAEKDIRIKDMEYRIGGRGRPGGASPDSLVNVMARRIGLEKHGDSFTLYVSLEGEPMHAFGPSIQLHIDGPFYAGIGFCSHLPDKSDTAILSNVTLENAAGQVH
jgi:hypothetical protein